ncbi:hypothetical protein VD659_14930 [Herbiconiux sp. 11R-BC]|uniref:hypothetical protein n=1 Tax=Herbiconiux sp. 11R-BC TaxID=3111637 RepID=UPI003C081897
MWDSFGPDLLVVAIGAALTGLIAGGTYLVTFRRLENQAVGALIRQIHERRAFIAVDAPVPIHDAYSTDDFGRVSRSVVTVRDEIDIARRSVGRSTDLQDALTSMKLACNRYLERSAQRPDGYVIDLMGLREELWVEIQQLNHSRSSLPALEPGAGAF